MEKLQFGKVPNGTKYEKSTEYSRNLNLNDDLR